MTERFGQQGKSRSRNSQRLTIRRFAMFDKKTFIAFSVAALVGVLGAGSVTRASDYEDPAGTEMNVGRGVICDTPRQIERFVALRSDGKDAEAALQVLNNDIADPNACAFTFVKFTDGEPIARLSMNGRLASILQITVHVFSNGSVWNDVSATVQYILVPEKGLIA